MIKNPTKRYTMAEQLPKAKSEYCFQKEGRMGVMSPYQLLLEHAMPLRIHDIFSYLYFLCVGKLLLILQDLAQV